MFYSDARRWSFITYTFCPNGRSVYLKKNVMNQFILAFKGCRRFADIKMFGKMKLATETFGMSLFQMCLMMAVG